MVRDKIFKFFCSIEMEFNILSSEFIKKWDKWRIRRVVPMYSFLLALIIILFLSSSSSYAVIYISSIEDLQKIGKVTGYPLNGEYELTQDIDASATINWNSGAGFAPIGSVYPPFTGKFDGKGYKITGLYINRTGTNYIGLFSFIGSGSEVKNIGIENCWISGNNVLGGLIAWNYGTVSNSYITGTVSGSANHIGGLVGWNEGTVLNSYSTSTVEGVDLVGGLIGNNYSGTVSNCYSKCTVSGNLSVGGLVGHIYSGTILNSCSTGTFRGSYDIGGLVGQNSGGTVSNSYSMGTVLGTNDIGGLIGNNYSGTVSNCYSIGFVNGNYIVGGLIGYNGGVVSGSYWNIETSGRSSSAAGTGKTTAQMKQQATFVGWDFTTIWKINEGSTYPYLLWQGSPLPEVSALQIPYLVGMDVNSARNLLEARGLTVSIVEVSSTRPVGEVIGQSPNAGVNISKVEEVYLLVSRGGGTALAPPSWVRAYYNGSQVIIRWEASVVSGVQYVLRRCSSSGNCREIYRGSETMYVDASPVEGSYYQVNVIGSGGVESGWSGTNMGKVRVQVRVGKVNVGQVSGSVSGSVLVPVVIDGVWKGYVSEVNLRLKYDPSRLKIEGNDKVWLREACRGMTKSVTIDNTLGKVVIKISAGNGVLGSGQMLALNFLMLGEWGIGTCSEIEIEELNLKDISGSGIAVESESGSVCVVSECMLGDVKTDRRVEEGDAKRVLDIWVGLAGRDACSMSSGDINVDYFLDSADASLILRMINGKLGEIGRNSGIGTGKEVVQVVGGELVNGSEMTGKVQMSDKAGLGSFELILVYGSEFGIKWLEFGLDLKRVISQYVVLQGMGYIRVGAVLREGLTGSGSLELLRFGLENKGLEIGNCGSLELRGVELRGVDGDDFRWYREVEIKGGQVCVKMDVESFKRELQKRFNELDKNKDGYVSWEEAEQGCVGLTQEVFNQVDTDGDGKISRTEAGLTKICGCGCQSIKEDWKKYILDFVLFGLLISLMSGMGKMQRRKKIRLL